METVKRYTQIKDGDCVHMRQELQGGRHDEFNFWFKCMDCQEILRWYPPDADEHYMADMRKRVY